MHHPGRERNIEAAIALLGFAVFAVALSLPGSAGGWREILPGVGGLTIGFIALVLALVAHVRDVRPYRQMRRGKKVLARWQIEAARWPVFLEQCRAITDGGNALTNSLALPATFPAGGVEVVVAENSLCVAGDFHSLKSSAEVRAKGAVLEIFQRVPAGRASARLIVYRVPVPEAGRDDVARIIQHYALSPPASNRLDRRFPFVLLAVALLLLGGALAVAC